MGKGDNRGVDDFRAIQPRFAPDAVAANQALVDLLRCIGDRQAVATA